MKEGFGMRYEDVACNHSQTSSLTQERISGSLIEQEGRI